MELEPYNHLWEKKGEEKVNGEKGEKNNTNYLIIKHDSSRVSKNKKKIFPILFGYTFSNCHIKFYQRHAMEGFGKLDNAKVSNKKEKLKYFVVWVVCGSST